jgi:hypothetical protein
MKPLTTTSKGDLIMDNTDIKINNGANYEGLVST